MRAPGEITTGFLHGVSATQAREGIRLRAEIRMRIIVAPADETKTQAERKQREKGTIQRAWC